VGYWHAADDGESRTAADAPRPPAPPGDRWPVVLGALSLGAALLHAAAAADHEGVLRWLFAATAVAQGTWALAVVARPRRAVLLAGAAGTVAVLGAYLASRTVGIGLEPVEPFGATDLIAAGFEVAVVAVVALLFAPGTLFASYRRIGPAAAVVAVLLVAIAAVPGLAGAGTGHDHHDAAGSGHRHDPDDGRAAHPGHGHDGSDTAAQARADRLVAATRRHARRWKNVASAEAAGYRTMRFGPVDHLVDWPAVDDGATLDPRHPEALVYVTNADASRTLVAAMYVAPWSATMATVPEIAGGEWHTHEDLCWDEAQHIVDFTRADGSCAEGRPRSMPPMLHVSLVDNACGPFGDPTSGLDRATRSMMSRFDAAAAAFGVPGPIVSTPGCEHEHSAPASDPVAPDLR
jgi:hypothetical protein